jgi:hypothetical protein
MKIRHATVNNRKALLELTVRSGKVFPVPYAKLDPRPTPKNRIREAYVDKELGSEAVTYVLESGDEVPYTSTTPWSTTRTRASLAPDSQAHRGGAATGGPVGLSRRELARRLSTSVPQLYRLLDPANTRKSLGQLVGLLHLLDCDVQLVVNPRRAA